jgi:O-Antigen ligase
MKALELDVRRGIIPLLLSLFLMIPFQRRFHGFLDKVSRSLTLPDVPLPESFSRKIHLFASDLVILALVLLLFFRCRPSLRAFFWEGPSKYLTLLFFTLLLSTGTAIANTYALQYFRLLQFSLVFLLFHSIKSLLYRIDLSSLIYKIAWLLVGISLFESMVGIYQYFSQGAIGWKFLGEIDPRKFPFVSSSEHLSLFGNLLGARVNATCLYRASGTFLHPNILGGFLFCAMMASYYLCSVITNIKGRFLLSGILFVQFFALCVTFSRAAMLALGVSSVIWCFLQLRHFLKSEDSLFAALKKLKWIVCIALCGLLLGTCLFYPQLKTRGGFFSYNRNTLIADTERVLYMQSAVEMIKEHPLLGVGYNHFQIAHHMQPRFKEHHLYSKVHNIYLLITSESGLIGGGLFLFFLITLVRSAWQSILRASGSLFQEGLFLLCAFLGFLCIGGCDFYFLDNPQGSLLFFGVAGLLSGMRGNMGTKNSPKALNETGCD